MVKLIPVIIAVIVLAQGCTPFSEEVVKRVKPEERIGQTAITNSDLVGKGSETLIVDAKTRNILSSYGPTIQRYANQYGFDWRLILAVMKAESRFHVDAESPKGATGLMQIMPVTSEEVARKLDIEDMTQPVNNIRGGVYYLKRLYNLFEGAEQEDRIKLTLAAYNAGIARVYDAQELAAYLSENPNKWPAVRDALPLLSKRYYTLHRSVWGQEKPKAGWFGSYRETVTYVDRIIGYYDEYQSVLN